MAVTLESLKKSVGKKNAKSEIFAWFADLERASGDLDGALQRINGGLTLYPHDVAAMIVRAKILFQQEKYDECVNQCEEILMKDTFNLAAQKIMGDAYDKLENVSERNLCYRRYHDMDPLNTFWKDEYDVVVEAAASAGVAALTDDDFNMPEMPIPSPENVKTLDELEAENAAAMGANAQEISAAALFSDDEISSVENSFEKAFGDTFGSLDDEPVAESSVEKSADQSDLPVEEPAQEDGGLFEKSASMNISLEDEPAAETKNESVDTFGEAPFASDNQTSDEPLGEDDPFAALAAMLPNGDAEEDSMMENLTEALDSTMADIRNNATENSPVEEFPVDDSISGSDVNTAIDSFFGMEDDLEPEESTGSSLSGESDVVDESAAANASMIFGGASNALDSSAEDKPVSLDRAFDDIFGEDELPEELPQNMAPAAADPAEKKIAEEPAENDLELPAEDALELPSEDALELPAEDSLELPSEEKLDVVGEELSAPASEESLETASEELPAVENKPMSVDSAFDDIFGVDELPEENLQNTALPATETINETLEPANETLEPALEEPPTELVASDDFTFLSESTENLQNNETQDDSAINSQDSSIDDVSLKPYVKPEASTEPADLEFPADLELPAEDEAPAEEDSFVSEVETPKAPAIASPMDFLMDDESAKEESLDENPAEETIAEPAEGKGFSVDSAFDSIFGSDEDLPEEKTSEVPETPTKESNETLAEEVEQAESELELPTVKNEEKSETSDFAQEMGGAFASMFGEQDDLDLPDLNTENEDKLNASATDQQATGAAFKEDSSEKLESALDKSFSELFGKDDNLDLPSEENESIFEKSAESAPTEVAKTVAETPAMSSVDSLESEVSGAFKGLFDMDDDSLNLNEDKPSNSGVDFLMSGDSDDEVSAGLINNPDAPLNRGTQNIDESLNTKTLAEIYFDQGLYGKALEIYSDLAQKEPENQEIAKRYAEVEKIYKEKFGGNG